MTKCPKYFGFPEPRNFGSSEEYLVIVGQLVEFVREGRLTVVTATYPLEDVFNAPISGDCFFHHFQCTTCGRAFQLFADTYQGMANWTPGDISTSYDPQS
jgi:hypothetical protein